MVGVFKNLPDNVIFIPGNVASSKNSKQWTGTKLIWSELARKYRDNTAFYWMSYRLRFKQLIKDKKKPLMIGMYFVRDSKRKFDFVNCAQTVQDLLTRYEWLEDDNITEMLPVPVEIDGVYYHVSKEEAGVYIIVL